MYKQLSSSTQINHKQRRKKCSLPPNQLKLKKPSKIGSLLPTTTPLRRVHSNNVSNFFAPSHASSTQLHSRLFSKRNLSKLKPLNFQTKRTHTSSNSKLELATGKEQNTTNCWNCPNNSLSHLSLFCDQCQAIQPAINPLSHQSYFALYSLPEMYELDLGLLEKKFHSLQQSLHPDLFDSKSETEQNISANYSTYINRSYDILKDDLLRAKYLIYLKKPDLVQFDESLPDYEHLPSLQNHPLTGMFRSGQASKSRLAFDQLAEILEKREIIEDSTNIDELVELYRSNSIILNSLKYEITKLLDQTMEFEEALVKLESFHYYQNMQEDLIQRVPSEALSGLKK